MSYQDKLKDPRWQKMRLEIMERDGFACRKCEAKDKTLHVHHHYYTKGAEPWEYDPSALITLCEECHENIEDHKPLMLTTLGQLLTSKSIQGETGYFAMLTMCRYIKQCEASGAQNQTELQLLAGVAHLATYEAGISYAIGFFRSKMESEGLTELYHKITETQPIP